MFSMALFYDYYYFAVDKKFNTAKNTETLYRAFYIEKTLIGFELVLCRKK